MKTWFKSVNFLLIFLICAVGYTEVSRIKYFDNYYWVIDGIVVKGTQSASGKTYFREQGGTINLQRPFFEQAGVHMEGIFNGSINVNIWPRKFKIINHEFVVKDVKWHPKLPKETFSLISCIIEFRGKKYDGYVYFPHPETKIGPFPGYSIIEILAPYVDNLHYGDVIKAYLPVDKIDIY